VRIAKHRWIIERDYEELKQELGLGHYEGRGSAAFTITLPSASRPMGPWWPNGAVFPPPLAPVKVDLPVSKCAQVPPSGLTRYAWRGIIPGRLLHSVKPSPEFCSGNSRVVLFVELHFYNTVVLAARG